MCISNASDYRLSIISKETTKETTKKALYLLVRDFFSFFFYRLGTLLVAEIIRINVARCRGEDHDQLFCLLSKKHNVRMLKRLNPGRFFSPLNQR